MRRGWRLFGWLGLLALPACFQLREPEPAAAAGEWTPPTQIDILLANFVTAVQNLNAGNYERTFTGPDFRFVPDPTSAGTAPALFANWSTTEELAQFNSLRRRSPRVSQQLTLTDRRDNLYTPDSAEVTALYELRIAQPDTAFRPKVLQGNLRLLVRRRQNEWRIAAWRDQRTAPNQPCWTDLKKYFIRN